MSKNGLLLYLAVVLVTISSCKEQSVVTEELEQPNIVWLTSEDNSPHYMKLFNEHGVETPNIEGLAQQGLTFTHAFSNTPVCSAARSTLISSCYGPRMASHYHRKMQKVHLPEALKMFPYYLQKAGYYTTNNAKEDYNIVKTDSVWNESSRKASWRNRKPGQPFFHVYNTASSHESRMHFGKGAFEKALSNGLDSVFIQPNHPQTPLFQYSNLRYRDTIQLMDKKIGAVIDELKKDGLMENTIIFYFGDHGGILPGSKGYINETGVEVPLVVYIPEKYKHLATKKAGSKEDAFVSFVDFGATVLNLAGVEIPELMDGKPFLGKGISAEDMKAKDETYSYADRFDEKYDMVRAIRKGKYKYERNYQPFNFDGLMNNYRYKQLGYQQWKAMYEAGELNDIQSQFFEPKAPEALYDVEADPFETKNLAALPEYAEVLSSLRENLNTKEANLPDLSFYPEYYLLKHACENPIEFGLAHKAEIQKYIEVANLNLVAFNEAKAQIEKSLKSEDEWERYWGLIVCSSFGEEAKSLFDIAVAISKNDDILINRARAAQFLGLSGLQNPVAVITDALYASQDPAEALLIFNIIVEMQDGAKHYQFNIDASKINSVVLEENLIKQRLKYLNPESSK